MAPTIEEIFARAEQERAQAAPATTSPTVAVSEERPWYDPTQLTFSVLSGVGKGGAGLVDLAGYLPIQAANMFGAGLPTFATTRIVDALIKGDDKLKYLEGPGAAQILGVTPDTEVAKATEFAFPGPGGKGKIGAQLVKEAGLGLASYFGSKGGEALTGSPYGSIAGALFAPAAVMSSPYLVKSGIKAGDRLMSSLSGSDEALQAAVNKEILATLSPDELSRLEIAQQAPELMTSASGAKKTVAEITQSAPAAKYQHTILENQGGGGVLADALSARMEAPQKALSKMGVTPEHGDFAYALRTTAEEAAAAKAAKENEMLSRLGFDEGLPTQSPQQLGETIQQGVIARADEAYDPVRDIWSKVKKSAQMDIAPQLNDVVNTFREFGSLTKKRISKEAKDAIRTARSFLLREDGLINVGEYQDLRAAANAALKNATNTTDKAEIALMRKLKDGLDNIDESAIIAKGTGSDVAKITDAIKATRDYYNVYGRGVVGDIIKKTGGELKMKASQVVERVLRAPENVAEILGKFGKDSAEAVALRANLLEKVAKAKNPTEHIGKYKDVYRQAFGDDYKSVVDFAQSKGKGLTGFEEFAKTSNANIPNKIFADEQAADRFMKLFKGTESEQFARAKFIASQVNPSGKGNAMERLLQNKKIAQKLFGDDYDHLEKLVNDIESAKSVDRLEVASAKGQSATKSRQTALGKLMEQRNLLEGVVKTGQTLGGIGGLSGGLGVLVAAGKGALATGIGGAIAGAAGVVAGNAAAKSATARLTRMNEIAATLVSNPELIKIAAAAPTKSNMEILIDKIKNLGIEDVQGPAARGAIYSQRVESQFEEQTPQKPSIPTAPSYSTAKPTLSDSDRERLLKLKQKLEAPASQSVQVGKQNVSALLDEIPKKYGIEPSLVKAIAHVESRMNPKAVGPKTRYGNAQGLMQLIPATSKALEIKDPFDPAQSIDGASRLLVELKKSFGGYKDTRFVLAAYNSRPALLRNAIAKVKADDEAVTWANVSRYMPAETRAYVNEVMKLV